MTPAELTVYVTAMNNPQGIDLPAVVFLRMPGSEFIVSPDDARLIAGALMVAADDAERGHS